MAQDVTNWRRPALGALIVAVLAFGAVWTWWPIDRAPMVDDYRYRSQFWEGIETDIGVWLPVDASDDDIAEVQREICAAVEQGSTECALLEGVRSLDTDYSSRTIWLQMMPGVSEERRDEIAGLLAAQPVVERVEVDVIVDFDRD